MRFISLNSETDFEGWRKAARALALNNVAPAEVTWTVQGNQPELFEPPAAAPIETPHGTFNVPAKFVELARDRDPASRHQAFCNPVSPAVAAAGAITNCSMSPPIWTQPRSRRWPRPCAATSTRCMPSCASAKSGARRVAFHRLVRARASHRRTGGAVVRKAFCGYGLVDPDPGRVRALGRARRSLTPGVSKADAPSEDRLEETWRRYYASIFNPARLKVKAMQAEMPKKYWRTCRRLR